MTDTASSSGARNDRRLLIPALGGIYSSLHDSAETILRVVAGLALVTHGMGKISDPFGAVGMVESLGFYPGVFWSPLLAATEFFGGILIALGLLTRPASFAALIVLLVTVWFHWITMEQGYSGAEKSILWSAVFLYFAVRGGNRHSLDARFGREF
ncbi:DoxX family protein [Aquamicrobium sp. LC103]|uniref:DoxX family protein n=1 Tax=Aquamicrobium sp. LC103 TaxID=1120658 RepID=UPI00063ECE10|nr:DoxX family protein [Aquamicrobium sp. LC103]TKT69317.1 DoxX family protein [Aquamicrobium sp. LC103]